MTEDLLEEQSEVLAKLGTSAEGTHLRARMQSACLLSDMESFKVRQGNIRTFNLHISCPAITAGWEEEGELRRCLVSAATSRKRRISQGQQLFSNVLFFCSNLTFGK